MEIRHGYLYLADLDPGRGTEAGELRPVVVIQTDYLNSVEHPSTWILPCTTKLVGENVLRVFLPTGIAGNKADCEVMIDQSRAVDNKSLRRELGMLPTPILRDLKHKLRLLGNF